MEDLAIVSKFVHVLFETSIGLFCIF